MSRDISKEKITNTVIDFLCFYVKNENSYTSTTYTFCKTWLNPVYNVISLNNTHIIYEINSKWLSNNILFYWRRGFQVVICFYVRLNNQSIKYNLISAHTSIWNWCLLKCLRSRISMIHTTTYFKEKLSHERFYLIDLTFIGV